MANVFKRLNGLPQLGVVVPDSALGTIHADVTGAVGVLAGAAGGNVGRAMG